MIIFSLMRFVILQWFEQMLLAREKHREPKMSDNRTLPWQQPQTSQWQVLHTPIRLIISIKSRGATWPSIKQLPPAYLRSWRHNNVCSLTSNRLKLARRNRLALKVLTELFLVAIKIELLNALNVSLTECHFS